MGVIVRIKKIKLYENFSFPDKMLMEMATVGKLNNLLTVIIRTNDPGNIPHFHIVDNETFGSKFHTCVKIEKPEYFIHTGKEDILNSKLRKELIEFFGCSDKWGVNHWDIVLQEWNRNNSHIEIDPHTPMPDYTKLKK